MSIGGRIEDAPEGMDLVSGAEITAAEIEVRPAMVDRGVLYLRCGLALDVEIVTVIFREMRLVELAAPASMPRSKAKVPVQAVTPAMIVAGVAALDAAGVSWPGSKVVAVIDIYRAMRSVEFAAAGLRMRRRVST